MKILYIDDNKSLTKLLSTHLISLGHECTVANSGRNGLTLMENNKFDVVLLDILMPEFTGFDVIDYLFKNKKIYEQNIILFTGATLSNEKIDELLRKGVHSYITKPAETDELLGVINASRTTHTMVLCTES